MTRKQRPPSARARQTVSSGTVLWGAFPGPVDPVEPLLPGADPLWAALDAVPDPVSVTTAVRHPGGWIADFRIEYVNLAACRWAGLERTAMVGELVSDILPTMESSGLFDILVGVVETGEPFVESAIVYDDIVGGRPVSGAYDLHIVKHGDGYVSVWRDVSSREEGVAELRRHSELVRAIVDSSPFATMAFDTERRLLFWNPSAERVFGWRADEVIGRPFPREAVPDEDLESSDARVVRTLGGMPVTGERIRRLTRDGRELMVEIHGGPLMGADGVAFGYAGQMVDVTRMAEMEADLAMVGRVNAILSGAVGKLVAGATFEQAATAICDELRGLHAVDFTAIGAFVDDGVILVAANAPDGVPLQRGDRLPPHRAEALRERANGGPWAQYWESLPEDGEWGRRLDEAGIKAFAFGPIHHGAHTDGGLMVATRDEAFARTLVEKWSSLIDFTTTPSALLAERLHDRRSEIALRRSLTAILNAEDFHSVFQPIVELASGDVVGHEALTRFGNGRRPDLVFADAWTVGLGPDLELATLRMAIGAARALPAGRWLDVNISPRLLDDAVALRAVLRTADRPIVLEITEHEVIEDYTTFLRSVRSLGHDIRLAVDDAGAGVANFAHIIDLGPDFVKLDVSLVRRVNAHLGRQALVVGMRYVSRTSGCRLVAEGIETAAEARTLGELGVEYGQGFWFGRPEPAG